MKILITGVNGFIGQHLAKRLIKDNHRVVGIGRSRKSKIKNLTYLQGSVLDKNLIKKAIKDTDVVVHLAALTSHKDIVDKELETQKTNLLGTRNVLEVFLKSKAKKFLYASTGKVYGRIYSLPITERHPTNPLNILGKSKLEAENLIKLYTNNKKEFIIFRIFNIYGREQNENFLVPTIMKQLKNDVKEIILGDIEAKRDYIYIDDVIDAFILAIEKKNLFGFSIFNICTGIGTSAFQIVDLVNRIKNTKIKIKINQDLIRTDEMKEEYGSFEVAKKELGWSPKINLKEGLKRILN